MRYVSRPGGTSAEKGKHMERKGFGIRLGAYLIDVVIMFIVIGGIVAVIFLGTFKVGFGTPNTAQGQQAVEGAARTVAIVGPLLGLAYASLEIFLAQSLGKMLLKIKIMDEGGTPAPMGQLVTRYLVKYSASIIGLLVGLTGIAVLGWLQTLAGLAVFIGCFFVLGEKRQALHDMAAKTAVFGAATASAPGFQPIMPPAGGNPPPPAV